MDAILSRLEDVSLFAAAHKCTLFGISIKWCGKWNPADGVRHNPERLSGWSTIRRPETARELMHFCKLQDFLAENG